MPPLYSAVCRPGGRAGDDARDVRAVAERIVNAGLAGHEVDRPGDLVGELAMRRNSGVHDGDTDPPTGDPWDPAETKQATRQSGARLIRGHRLVRHGHRAHDQQIARKPLDRRLPREPRHLRGGAGGHDELIEGAMNRQSVAHRDVEQLDRISPHDDPRRLLRCVHQLHQQIRGQQVQDRLQQSNHRAEQRWHDVRQQVRQQVRQDIREQVQKARQHTPQQPLPRGEIHGRQAEDHR